MFVAGKGKSGKGQAPLDPQEMEKALRQLTGGFSVSMGMDLDRAQDVVYQAMEESDRSERIRMAHQALGITLDCPDAYVLLAQEDTESVEEAFYFYRKAVGVAEKVLGPKVFEEHTGHFWGIREARSYMRARLGFTGCLWEMGQRGEAVEHYRDLLMLDPMDHLGVRYLLMPSLIELGRDDEAEKLYGDYAEEDSASWLYSWVLLAFRREGEGPVAEQALRDAMAFNPYVPEYITDRRRLPKHLPEDYDLGDRDEAIIYTSENLPAWGASKGAREWLKRKVPKK